MNAMQQEFDAVVEHLYKQGRPAKRSDGHTCLYRTPSGLSCAVGCRIPDAVYKAEMDDEDAYNNQRNGTGIYELLEVFGSELPDEIEAYSTMFSRLQAVHDDCTTTADGSFNLNELTIRLNGVATHFHLTFTKPQAV